MKNIIVIGGGISGLATAYLIQKLANENNLLVNIQIIEKEPRLGGKIWSRQIDGYLCEWGPNGFLTNKPQTLELCHSLGIDSQLLASSDNARKRFVYSNGKLHKLPHNQLQFVTNSLISWAGKLRIMKEFFVPKRKDMSDESLSDFTKRRLGVEALNKLIAPMAGGVFAGNPDTMSLKSCFPRIYQLEQEYGGLLKAMLKLSKIRKKELKAGKVVASPAGPGGVLTSFYTGIEELVVVLKNKLNVKQQYLSSTVTEVTPTNNQRWQIHTHENTYLADAVICATPAYSCSKYFKHFDTELADKFKQIAYAPLIVVCLGYNQDDVTHDLNGFGYLLARGETLQILGTLWDSSIFINRAPDGKVLFRTMLGGASNPELIKLDDEQLQILVTKSLEVILGITKQPELVQIYRHEQAIPEYQVGHTEIVESILHNVAKYAGLFITGNAYFGVGINDCVAQSYKTSQVVIDYLLDNQEHREAE